MSALPSESIDEQTTRRFESRAMRLGLWLLPILIIAAWVLLGRYPKWILFLQQPNNWSSLLSMKILAPAIAIPTVAMVGWSISIRLSDRFQRTTQSLLSIAVIAVTLVGCGLAFTHPRAVFVLREAVKSRAVQASFVRNMAFKQELFATPATAPTAGQTRIALVGSSQINLGIDPESLKQQTGSDRIVSACMPGMVPTQYLAISREVRNQQPTHVVCWLSEFDFFRETKLPVIRVRWVCDPQSVGELGEAMTPAERFEHRGELADLVFAAASPIWKLRSMFQLIAFRFWWTWDQDVTELDEDEKRIGGRLVDKDAGIKNAKQNIQRTPLVELNFRAFEGFAKNITDSGAILVVLEGESHPDTMAAYPSEFRAETRERLQDSAQAIGFNYVTSDGMPTFVETDWRDAVHLNANGQEKLTHFVADYLAQLSDKPTR
ncbi:MAG: hypothetical protein AAFX06_04025 [Planctomycetota bacterium]